MEEAQAATALNTIGRRVHSHDGVWWEQVSRGFCKPVDRTREISPGKARPRLSESLLGFSHVVPSPDQANYDWNVMHMGQPGIEGFSLASISPKRKQQKIKQALRTLTIQLIDRIDPWLGDMLAANVATAGRTGHGKPAEYYTQNRDAWEKFMRTEFSLAGREWWGAFHEGRLIAYYYIYVIGRVLHVSAAKSNTEFLHLAPNDALVYTIVSHHSAQRDCDQIIYGDWSPETESLNDFKRRFGFEVRRLPVYRHLRPQARLLLGLRGWGARWKRRNDHPGPVSGVESGATSADPAPAADVKSADVNVTDDAPATKGSL